MTPQPRLVKKSIAISDRTCATMRPDDARAPWLVLLHGMTVIVVGLRKWLKTGDSCEHCGRRY